MQVLVIGIVAAFFGYIIDNTATNLVDRGISTGFGFVNTPAGYDVSQALVDFEEPLTHGQMFIIGLLNTFLVAAIGVVLATIVGLIFGVMRLSDNWLAAAVAYLYVDIIRNIPVLLQILFWYGVLLALPGVRKSLSIGDSIFLNNRGLFFPAPIAEDGAMVLALTFLAGIIGAIGVVVWNRRRQKQTGQTIPAGRIGFGLLIACTGLAYFVTGRPIAWDIPELKGFGYRGGLVMSPEFTALLLALVIYTATYIAEIFRSAIQSVSAGQREAASALGLQQTQVMNLVLIPQALRVAVPQLTSQYLNLTKNSSLAVTIGYPDLVATFGGTSLNQTGQAVEVIAITMAVYLSISLGISVFMNFFNARVALKER